MKEYNCAKCETVLIKLKTDCGNLVRSDASVICDPCLKTLESYEKIISNNNNNNNNYDFVKSRKPNPLDMFGDLFPGFN